MMIEVKHPKRFALFYTNLSEHEAKYIDSFKTVADILVYIEEKKLNRHFCVILDVESKDPRRTITT